MVALFLISWDSFGIYSTAERNLKKFDVKQVFNILYQDCVYRSYS